MLLGVVVILLPSIILASTETEKGIICPKGISTFACDPVKYGKDKYWFCSAPGMRAILKTCRNGLIYNRRCGRCRRRPGRLEKRSIGNNMPKDLEILEIENVGFNARLGQLYNAREEAFVPGSFAWSNRQVRQNMQEKPMVYSNVDVYQDNTVDDRAYHLYVNANLKIGFLSGMIDVQGTAEYLRDEKDSSNIARVTMSYRSTTKSQTMPITVPIRESACARAQQENGPTHIVTAAVKGLRAFLVFDQKTTSTESVEKISGKLQIAINAIPAFRFSGSAWVDIHGRTAENIEHLSVMYRGDAIISTPQSYASAINSFNEVQAAAPTSQHTIKYQLTPLSYLCDSHVATMMEIGTRLVNRATDVLVELSQVKLETDALREHTVARALPTVRNVLNTFSNALTRYTNDLKLKIKRQLLELRRGQGAEINLAIILGEYDTSAFSYNKAKSFLQVREREISTIDLVMKAAAGKSYFIVAESDSSADNDAILSHRFAVFYYLNVLPRSIDGQNAAEDYIRSGQVMDGSDLWYNNMTAVGETGHKLQEFIKYGDANAPQSSTDKTHCFIIRVKEMDPENDNIAYIKYILEKEQAVVMNFVPPPTPPKPICTPQFQSIKIRTAESGNEFVTQHWVEDSQEEWDEDTEVMNIRTHQHVNPDTDTLSSFDNLTPNSIYNITTRYKVFEEDKAGFSTVSAQTTCYTAPTTPVLNLAVFHPTRSSLRVSWERPQNVAVEFDYVIRVLKEGGDEEDAVIVRTKDQEVTINGLESATLYHVTAHTESQISYSEKIEALFSTAPDTIPFPEVISVRGTEITLSEKLGLVELARGLNPTQLLVEVYQVNSEGGPIAEQQSISVDLEGSKADKEFTIGELEAGRSYGITVVLEVSYEGTLMKSRKTDQLSVTTPIGGSDVEKLKKQFEQLQNRTADRTENIEEEVDTNKGTLNEMMEELQEAYDTTTSSVNMVAQEMMGNLTNQETVLNRVSKKSCEDVGVSNYEPDWGIPQVAISLYTCLGKCRESNGCEAANWMLDRTRTEQSGCYLRKKRRGDMTVDQADAFAINRVCYDTMTGDSTRWITCLQPGIDFRGATLVSSTSFTSHWECLIWCLNTANCRAFTYTASSKTCDLKEREDGNGRAEHSDAISLNLGCMYHDS